MSDPRRRPLQASELTAARLQWATGSPILTELSGLILSRVMTNMPPKIAVARGIQSVATAGRRRHATSGSATALRSGIHRAHWAAFAGFAAGRGARVVSEDVNCVSALRFIDYTVGDGWNVSVPLDIAWTDISGGFHEGGRPECLQPASKALGGPVRVDWTNVDLDGRRWRQVLAVTRTAFACETLSCVSTAKWRSPLVAN